MISAIWALEKKIYNVANLLGCSSNSQFIQLQPFPVMSWCNESESESGQIVFHKWPSFVFGFVCICIFHEKIDQGMWQLCPMLPWSSRKQNCEDFLYCSLSKSWFKIIAVTIVISIGTSPGKMILRKTFNFPIIETSSIVTVIIIVTKIIISAFACLDCF